MPDPRDEHVRSLLARILELPPAARRPFFATKCRRDAILARRLAVLLVEAGDEQFAADAAAPLQQSESSESSVSPEPALPPPPAPSPVIAGAQVGDRIGPYHLLQLIGEGGFGTVYLAEQKEPIARQVAFKVLKPGMDSAQVVARFEQERQALAVMDHPNIAKVLDAGTTPRGLPYFVMELCRGESLTTWCDKNRRTITERLMLFVQICQAVQHAHGKGIIHRDLKPSNILVGMQDGQPTAKVIDFGIAKALSNRLTDRTLFTAAEQIIGTLQYMSPEQADGSLDIDTRADVYSLGVVLYEVLTGSTPFDDPTQRQISHLELHRRIRETDPHKPSTRLSASSDRLAMLAQVRRTEPRRLSAQLRGELDWIVMKAIDRDRTRRYPTAQDLAQDVQRFLDGAPVSAAPPSTSYLLRKFVRQHRSLVIGAAAVAATLIAGAIAFAWQAAVARGQRDLAVTAQRDEAAARMRAEDVAGLLEGVFESIDPEAEATLGLPFRDQLRQRLEGVVAGLAERDGDPLTRARLQVAFGKTLLGLSEPRQAESLLRAAATTRREMLGSTHADTIVAAEALSASLLQLGRFDEAEKLLESLIAEGTLENADLMLGMVYRVSGRLPDGIAALERERDRLAVAGGTDTEDGLLALHSLGACYREAGRAEDAIVLLEEVLRRRTALLGPTNTDTLTTSNSLAVALSEAGRHEEALRLYTANRELLLQRFAPNHQVVLTTVSNLALQLGNVGRAAEGIPMLEQARAQSLERLPPDHPDVLRIELNLGKLYFLVDRFDEALVVLRRAEEKSMVVDGPESERAQSAALAIARCLAGNGKPAEAIAKAAPAIARLRTRYGDDHRDVLSLRNEFAGWQRECGQFDDAIANLEDVIERFRTNFGDEDRGTLAALAALGATRFRKQDAQGAIAVFEPTLPICERRLGPDHELTRQVRHGLGSAYWLDRQLDRSVPILKAVLVDECRVRGATAASSLRVALDVAVNLRDARLEEELFSHLREWLGSMFRAEPGILPTRELHAFASGFLRRCQSQNRMAEAVDCLAGQYDSMQEHLGRDDPAVLTIGNNLASACWFAGAFDRAVPLLTDLLERTRRVHGADDPRTLLCTYNLAVNLSDAGRPAEALPFLETMVDRALRGEIDQPGDLPLWQRQLAATQAKCGQRERCRQTVSEYVAAARRSRGEKGRVDSELVQAGLVLLDAGFFADAEPLLRECLEIRARLQPAEWNTSYVRVLLGTCLHGLGRDDEARAFLEQGCTELRRIGAAMPPQGRSRVVESADRMLTFLADIGDETAAAPWREWQLELRAKSVR
ncbi:MAG: tetratricopeptide repeat protein [Planctomycetota bacterium]